MDELFDYSERVVRAAITRLPDGRFEGQDVLEAPEGDLAIRAAVTIAGDEIVCDFSGTAPQHPGNLNCPISVTRSACYFVVRCLTAPDLPSSGGAFAPVSVSASEGSLVNASPPAAVAAGNVETSGRIVDTLFAALGDALPVPAQGQGTMNNLTFGNERFTYYETLGGGQGACPDANGPSAVHVTMSNTLNTPAEALELAYPLRVERHALRLGSGGDGRPLRRRRRHPGADSARAVQPVGDLGAPEARAPRRAGRRARSARRQPHQRRTTLPAKATRELAQGDVVRIETPGGGGFSSPNPTATPSRDSA